VAIDNYPLGLETDSVEKLAISLVTITFNEQDNIERCIKSVPWCDDIVVVDSKSTDRTPQIAKDLGARVFVEEWRGYGPQKNRATSLAKNDWVIFLDADEALSPELASEIKSLYQTKSLDCDAYEFPRLSIHMKREIRHGGWFPDRQKRFFNRTRCQWTDVNIHEELQAQKVGRLAPHMFHWPFKNLSHQIQKNNHYSTLQAVQLHHEGKRFSCLKFWLKPVSKFIECYFLKRGFLDGMPGLIVAIGAAYSVHLKWAKLWEIELKHLN
jgi:glycosyltransferase involved in cell wall biosynthesis